MNAINVDAIVADYQAGADLGTLADRYSQPTLKLKKADISAYLRLHNIPIRRGNPKLADFAEAARATRLSNSLTKNLTKLIETHTYAVVAAELNKLGATNE